MKRRAPDALLAGCICTQGEKIKNNAPKRKKDNLPYRGAGKFLQRVFLRKNGETRLYTQVYERAVFKTTQLCKNLTSLPV